MKKAFPTAVIALSLLLLIGAGCTETTPKNNQQDTPQAKSADTMEKNDDTNEQKDAMQTNGIALEAEALGDNEVQFSWNIADDVERTTRMRLVRSEEPNPEHTGTNYWYQVHGQWNSATWINVPKGTYHFRLCTFEDNECLQYSNDVEVTVE